MRAFALRALQGLLAAIDADAAQGQAINAAT
jgi:hypothetical protein